MANVLTRNEVKLHLNMSLTSTMNDTEVDAFTGRAEAAIANRVGSLVPATVTEAHDGGSHLIKTLASPVRTIASLNESYGTYNRALTEQPLDGSNGFTAYGYTVDRQLLGGVSVGTGTIERRISGVAGPFASGRRNVIIVFTTGWSTDSTSATMPADLVEAVLERIRETWEASQRGGNVAPGRPQQVASASGSATFGAYVEQLLQPFADYGIA